MHEATFIVIFGLCFDIAGAIVIVKPILHRYTKIDKSKEIGAHIRDYVDRNQGREDEKGYKDQSRARLGVCLLSIGFILQAIGAWLENPPSINLNG